ncbi:MAG: hypothetical protein AB1666_02495 [Pseudomonadota bacterium]
MRVFVTTELHPVTAGGIGRVIANVLLRSSTSELRDTVVILVGSEDESVDRLGRFYAGATFYAVSDEHYDERFNGCRFPDSASLEIHPWLRRSLAVLQRLKEIENAGTPIDYIEFPDWGGLAFASLQEKKLGRLFSRATIAVRLHSPDGLLACVEGRPFDTAALALYDLERKALRDADLIIGQIPEVAEQIRRHYAFTPSEWNDRLHIHPSPVVLDTPLPKSSLKLNPHTDLLFPSKLQAIKGPDIFVRGAVGFMKANPWFKGNAILAAHSFDIAYDTRIKNLVPHELKHRFKFLPRTSQAERARLIASSICVFPSTFEAFCLAAYEASLGGGICVLNGKNPAFSSTSPWVNGKNCLLFNGTPEGLRLTLEGLFRERPLLAPVKPPTAAAPWTLRRRMLPGAHSSDARTKISAILVCAEEDEFMEAPLRPLLCAVGTRLELIVVVNGTPTPAVTGRINRLRGDIGQDLKIVQTPAAQDYRDALNLGLDVATGDYVLIFWSAGVTLLPSFLELAQAALQQNPEFDFVTSPLAFVDEETESLSPDQPERYRTEIALGEAPTLGLQVDAFFGGGIVGRIGAVRRLCSAPLPGSREAHKWAFALRAVHSGHRVLVTSDVQMFAPVATSRKDETLSLARLQVSSPEIASPSFLPLPLGALSPNITNRSGLVAAGPAESFAARWTRRRKKWKRSIQKRLGTLP